MFPLGTVLVPSLGLPIHVFEPRYRALVRDCLAGDGELGVVLIERGSEVGGGDLRSGVGTVAGVLDPVELPDGRWTFTAVGLRRLRVVDWLPDDPYPRADVEEWPDPPPGPSHEALLEQVLTRLRRTLALATEAGDAAPPATIELTEDPVLAGYQAAAVAPIGALDRQRLLCAAAPEQRLEQLDRLLVEVSEVLELRLAGA